MARLAILLTLLALTSAAGQDLPSSHRRALEEERRARQLERSSAEESRSDVARRQAAPKDPKACESARIHYQAACGAPYSARSRSMRCAEADAVYRANC